MPAHESSHRKVEIICLVIVLVVGIFFRLPQSAFSGDGNPFHALESFHPEPKMNGIGFDEGLYRGYLNVIIDKGLGVYPEMVQEYVEVQGKMDQAILPPVRFLYIFAGYVWHSCFGSDALASLRWVASFFSILTLILSGIFAWRLRDRATALAVTALMSCAPTQIHMSQHALIDGFFAFWALLCLWMLWENLQTGTNWRWILAYTVALALLVITKENSFFVWCGLVAVIVANRWLQLGTVRRELLLATIAGPLLGVVILVFLAGGLDNLITIYRLLVTKASITPYAIITGDGPWHRYLVDLLLVSPLVLLLALGTIFRLDRTKKPELYISIFIAATYLIMCNVKYGMNLRYANMWDMPLRFLAFGQIGVLAALVPRYRTWLTAILVGLVAGLELRQYYILAVQYPLYELITHDLLRALHILK
jgi:4-amino-4-deoxy-L-arabinose transferase and related glycosyltransferases of PMT family